jgi:hypothetical protein
MSASFSQASRVRGNFPHLSAGFFIIGCLFIAAGAIVKSNYQGTIFSLNTTLINARDAQDLHDFAHLAPIALIVLGSVMTLVSLVGCIGSSFEKRYLLIMYTPPPPSLTSFSLVTRHTSHVSSATAPSLPSSLPPKSPSAATPSPSKRTSGSSVPTLSTAVSGSPAAAPCLISFAASG